MARFSNVVGFWLWSLGLALLVLSVLLVPTSRVLSDTGGAGPLGAGGCLAHDGCNSGGCALLKPAYTNCDISNDRSNCSWNVGGCQGCGCRQCIDTDTGLNCDCWCSNTGNASCVYDVQLKRNVCPRSQ
jgi:hypothetical protein